MDHLTISTAKIQREQLINECRKKDKNVNKEDEDVKKKIRKLSIYEQMKLYCEIAPDEEEAILDKLDNFFDFLLNVPL